MIGAAAAIQGPTRDVKRFREHVARQNWRRAKIKLISTVRFGGTLRKKEKELDGAVEEPSVGSFRRSPIGKLLESSASYRQDAREALRVARTGMVNKLSRWKKKVRGE